MAQLRVRVLGGLSVEDLEPAALGSRKQRRLLARLIVARGAVVPTDELAEDLWGEAQPAQPRDQLSVLVSRLRSSLPDGALIRRDGGYALVADWLDLDALAERTEQAARRAADQHWPAAAEAARAALALLHGPVLPEAIDAPWVMAAQDSADRCAQHMRMVLARAELAVGDPRIAADLARDAVAASPYDEVALRLHLEACLAARSPALGLATYSAARSRLADELGVDPAAETQALYQRLLQATGPTQPEADVPAPGAPPGRSHEFGLALRVIERASRGTAGLLVVTGEPGIGKTSVLAAVAQSTRHQVIRAQCDELGRVLPLQPLLDGLREVLRLKTPEELASLLSDDAGLLAPMLSVGKATGGSALPVGGTGQLLVQAALVRLLDRLAGSGAVVLLVDDGHRADAATVALIAGLSRRASRVAAVVAARSGEGPAWPDETVVELGPLDLTAVTQVVGPERAVSLHARSGGHPLLLSELARADEDAVPDNLRAAFAAAADSAGRAGHTLRAASVLGADLDLDILAQVLRRPAVELLDDLEEGVRRRLLVENTSGFAFRHALVREALAADVGPTRRALLHRETARALHTRGTADPLVLAFHASAGGDAQIAVEAFLRAGQIAADRQAHDEALLLAEQALRVSPDHAGAGLLQARALLVLGRYAEAAEAAAAAVDHGAGATGLQVAGLAAHCLRDWDLATRLADEAAASTDDPELRATSLAVAAHARHAAGDLTGAEERFGGAGTAAGPVASGWLALLRQHQGRSVDALVLTERPAAAPSVVEQFALPLAQMSRGLAYAALGRSADALACFASIEQLVERFGLERFAGRADNCRGYVLRNLGLLSQADDLNAAAQEAGRAIGVEEPVAHALLDLAEGRLRAGDLDAARQFLEEAQMFATAERRHGFQWRHLVRARWLHGRLHLALGELTEAALAADAVIEAATQQGIARYAGMGRLLSLHVRAAAGDPPDIAETLPVVAELGTTAGMEQLWLVSRFAAVTKGRLRTALHAQAVESADRLVLASPPDLVEATRKHAAVLLS